MNNLWFKRKTYGWGWYPATWQGWGVILVYAALLTATLLSREEYVPGNEMSGSNVLTFALPIFVLTALLVFIAYKKGGTPRWQWGERSGEPD